MEEERRYTLVFDTEVEQDLDAIDVKYHSLIRRVIREQLELEPEVETRNRKPLRTPAFRGATWEIRFGAANRFRVLYAVDVENNQVAILAIGRKERNRLMVGKDEVKLTPGAGQLPFPQCVDDQRRQRHRAPGGVRLRWADPVPAVGALAHRDGGLAQIHITPP